MALQKWEYLSDSFANDNYLGQKLNAKGQLGWEAVAVHVHPNGSLSIVFKRPLA